MGRLSARSHRSRYESRKVSDAHIGTWKIGEINDSTAVILVFEGGKGVVPGSKSYLAIHRTFGSLELVDPLDPDGSIGLVFQRIR